MAGAKQLITSAFGASVCLYEVVLQCKAGASAAELRKAYHKRALRFHPDKNKADDATLKFQAISAAYQLLSDSKKRAVYDSTGKIVEEELSHYGSSGGGTRKSQENDNDRWTEFFQSVFQDILSADSNHDRATYCGSKQEREEVLKFYKVCRGDLRKILGCIVLSEKNDVPRWVKNIIEPAICNGQVPNFEAFAVTCGQVGKSACRSAKKYVQVKRKIHSKSNTSKLKSRDKESQTDLITPRKRKLSAPKACHNDLIDTDDEDETSRKNEDKMSSSMSKRDKLEYRVAKKQKEKREKEIQLAKLIQGKGWDASTLARTKTSRSSTFSVKFLSSLEEKFSADDKPIGKKLKKKRKS